MLSAGKDMVIWEILNLNYAKKLAVGVSEMLVDLRPKYGLFCLKKHLLLYS